MSFSAGWLALREPYDAAARDRALEAELARWAALRLERRRRAGEPEPALRVVDLGSGTGSNLRHLRQVLPHAQSWVLVERDRRLIEAGTVALARTGVPWRYVEADLTSDLETVLAEPVDLVTASALLDLVSAGWLVRLATAVEEADAALLAVLTYGGEVRLTPALPDDARVLAAVNRHQVTDKGFGPALGPQVAPALAKRLRAVAGYRVAPSDWHLGPADGAIQEALAEGYAEAACEIEPQSAPAWHAWLHARRAAIAAGRTTHRVGHLDVLRLPPG